MDWSVMWSAFLANAAAEVGDRTQIAIIALSASSGKPVSVFLGAILGIAAVCAVSAAMGEAVVKAVSPQRLERFAALTFIVMGLWMWARSGRSV